MCLNFDKIWSISFFDEMVREEVSIKIRLVERIVFHPDSSKEIIPCEFFDDQFRRGLTTVKIQILIGGS